MAAPTRVTVRDSTRPGTVTTFPAAGLPSDYANNAVMQAIQQYADDRSGFLLNATIAGLPTPDPVNTGRLARVTDGIRGIWKDTGTAWVSVTGYADVRDFGATGNGVTNDTVAIQAALDAAHTAGAGNVYAAAGTYLLTTLTWPGNNLTLQGAGSGYSYSTTGTVRTIFKAMTGAGTHLIDLGASRTNNHIVDVEIDGNLLSQNGIHAANANIIERTWIRGTLNAGVLLDDLTNGTRILDSALVDNLGYGLRVDGASTTTYVVERTNISNNQGGGAQLKAGFGVSFNDVIIESNGQEGLTIYRPDTHVNKLGRMTFRNLWLEDNGNVAAILIDAQTRSEANAPRDIHFDGGHISVATNKDYIQIGNGKAVHLERIDFDNSTNSTPIGLNATSFYVLVTEPRGLNDAQIQNIGAAPATGFKLIRYLSNGTSLVAGDIALSAGWGSTASISAISGTDQRMRFTITSAGTGQGANPTATLTFKNGTWGAAPFAVCSRNGGSQPAVLPTWTTTATTLVITFPGTPVAAETFTFECVVMG